MSRKILAGMTGFHPEKMQAYVMNSKARLLGRENPKKNEGHDF